MTRPVGFEYDYNVFENELEEWFIDTLDGILGPFGSQREATKELKAIYPEVEAYGILPYSEATEWQ